MSFHGTPFIAQEKNGLMEGNGLYTYPSGNVYVGEVMDGKFHGFGTIFFKTGGTFEGEWTDGKAKNGKYTFKDGLVYEEQNWEYCTINDRRLHKEKLKPS